MKEPKKELFNEIWFYYKKWCGCARSDEEWAQIIREGEEITKKHNDDAFAKGLVYEIKNELGRNEK